MPKIRVIDFETTGMEPPFEVVEAAYCDLIQGDDGVWGTDRPQSWLCAVSSIPPETRAIHHITLADVRAFDPEAQPFDGAGLVEMSDDHCAILAAHNMAFEEQWLQVDGIMPTLCTLKAALRVWPDAPGHSNGVLRYWLEDQGLISLNHDLAMPSHRAGPDAYVTAHILKALLETGATARDMVAWTKEPRLLPTCPIGKFRGKPWSEVEAGFLNWMINQPTMESDLKWNARRELVRRSEGKS